MSELNNRELELVALGAAIASNCVPCIEHHIPEARKAGLSDIQIKEAIQIADRVRRVPARKVLQTARAMIQESSSELTATAGAGCGCAESAASSESDPRRAGRLHGSL
jgi:4-carboxymuconolactone decarboxylase